MNRLWISLALAAGIVAAIAPAASATTLTVSWSSLSSSVKAGTYVTATVKATPAAKCGIVVKYSTTISHASGLVTKTVPSTGRLSWRWKVGTSTHAGTWRVTVTCKLGTQTKAIWRTMTIRK